LRVGNILRPIASIWAYFALWLQYSATITGTVDLLFDSKYESCDLQVDGTDYVPPGLCQFFRSSISYSWRLHHDPPGQSQRIVQSRSPSEKSAIHLLAPICIISLETVVVDDRPTTGGGLPAFLEATVARIVGQLDRNPNIEAGLCARRAILRCADSTAATRC